jgi:capsular exopolysaccharide synthesis family protein
VENLTLARIYKLTRKNMRLIMIFAVSGFIIGLLYAVTVFKPVYKSTAKLMIKNLSETMFVSELRTGSSFTPLVRDGNPALTQIEIITSDNFAKKVWNEISKTYKFKDDPKIGVKLMKEAISVQNPVGTDIIEITSKWHDPKIAKAIAETYKNVYINSTLENDKNGIVQSRELIDRQLKNAEANLEAAREKLKNFRQTFSTIDIEREAESSISQLTEIENRYNETVSDAASAANISRSIANQLSIDWNTALNSVAIGHNTNYTELQSKLGAAREELAGLSTKYATTHPAMKAINARIENIKNELQNQIRITLGDSSENNGVIITDPVRTGLVEDLASSEASYRGAMGQAEILQSAIRNLKNKISSIPQKQAALSNLIQEETNWTTVVNALKAKQVEAGIREAEIVSEINVIDIPEIPLYPSFPSKSTVVLAFALLSALIGILSILVDYLIKGITESTEDIEEVLKAPVIGVIPWLKKEDYIHTDSLLVMEGPSSYYSLAYQKIVTSLNIKADSGVKVLSFTSSEYSKSRSTILMNVAYGLNKAGNSVIVIDSDFRTPSVHQEFNIKNNEQTSLVNLLSKITQEIRLNGSFSWQNITGYIHEIQSTKPFHIIANRELSQDPYEFLHSNAMHMLIEKLKEKYDWVLIDTPPALAVPDALTIGSYSDGTLLSTGLNSARSNLAKVHKLFKDNNIKIFGVIAREVQLNEAASSNEYIKQIISRMMPETDDILTEKHDKV